MSHLASDARRSLREQMLARARDAERRGEIDKARLHYARLANLCRAQATDAEEKERGQLLTAAEQYERLAQGRDAERIPVGGAADDDATAQEIDWVCERPDVKLDDVIGLDEAKAEIQRRFITPFERPDLRRTYNVKAGGFLLLYGPPGNGKTFLARAVAGELGVPFFVVSGSNLLSKYVGESEANLSRLFEAAGAHSRSLIFLDELEWLAPNRMSGETSEHARRLVGQLLQELNNFDHRRDVQTLIIGATNLPWDLDVAAIRSGRTVNRIYVGLPSVEARELMLKRALEPLPTAGRIDCRALAGLADGFSAADVAAAIDRCSVVAMEEAAQVDELVKITAERVGEAIKSQRPTTPAGLLKAYQQWGAEH